MARVRWTDTQLHSRYPYAAGVKIRKENLEAGRGKGMGVLESSLTFCIPQKHEKELRQAVVNGLYMESILN